MKEEEARKKWCPFSRVAKAVGSTSTGQTVPSGQTAMNRLDPSAPGRPILPDAALCIGSLCMAWRLEMVQEYGAGYCGLAGEP